MCNISISVSHLFEFPLLSILFRYVCNFEIGYFDQLKSSFLNCLYIFLKFSPSSVTILQDMEGEKLFLHSVSFNVCSWHFPCITEALRLCEIPFKNCGTSVFDSDYLVYFTSMPSGWCMHITSAAVGFTELWGKAFDGDLSFRPPLP